MATTLTVNIKQGETKIGSLTKNEEFPYGTVYGTFLTGIGYLQKRFGYAVGEWSCKPTRTNSLYRSAWKVNLPKDATFDGKTKIHATIIVDL